MFQNYFQALSSGTIRGTTTTVSTPRAFRTLTKFKGKLYGTFILSSGGTTSVRIYRYTGTTFAGETLVQTISAGSNNVLTFATGAATNGASLAIAVTTTDPLSGNMNSAVYATTDGVTWNATAVTDGNLFRASWASNAYFFKIDGTPRPVTRYLSGSASTVISSTSGSGGYVAYAAGTYYHASGTAGFKSTDGITWTTNNPTGFHTTEFAVGATIYGVTSNTFASSTNGITWTNRFTFPGTYIRTVYGSGVFLTAQANGDIYLSRDGTNFTLIGANGTVAQDVSISEGLGIVINTTQATFIQ